MRQVQCDGGEWAGQTTAEKVRIKELEREVRELRQANDILKKAVVGSTGQRNGSFEGISRRLEAKCFSWPCIEAEGDLIEVTLGVCGQVCPVWQILP